VVRDPWRTIEPPVSRDTAGNVKTPTEPTLSQTAAYEAGDDIAEDMGERRSATIELKKYGGITVTGAASPSHAAAQVLKLCVDNLKLVESTLTTFGIIVTKMQPGKLTTPFYVQRDDGWTLAIPMVRNRDEGCLQLIQAMLALRMVPGVDAKMQALKIQPYKM